MSIVTKFLVWDDNASDLAGNFKRASWKVRLDKWPQTAMSFVYVNGGTMLFFLESVGQLKRFSTCENFTIQIPALLQPSVRTITFALTGLANCIKQLETESGLNSSSWVNSIRPANRNDPQHFRR
jgi:hypothetical protein